MSLDKAKLQSVIDKTAYAAPMADPMAPAGAPPMDPAMMAGAMPPPGGAMPPMDPSMMGGAPMDPMAAAGGAPPMDPAMAEQLMAAAGGAAPMDPMAAAGGAPPAGPMPEQVGAVAADPAVEEEPKVGDMTLTELETLIGSTVTSAIEQSKGEDQDFPGQLSDIQDEIAGMKEEGGAIPVDAPTMPVPELPAAPAEVGMTEEALGIGKVAAEVVPQDEEQGQLLNTLQRMNNLR